ncbi:porin [Rhodanobacter sp. UC4448_H15]
MSMIYSFDRRHLAGWCALALATGAAAPATAADTPVGATTFNGKIFLDATHLNQYKNGKRTKLSPNGADLRRFYIDIDHRFSTIWSAHLTTDINWTRNQSPTDLWVKQAYLEGAFSKALVLRFGSAYLPWNSLVNSWYGYRYVEKEMINRLNYGVGADWGVHMLGKTGGEGQIQYAVSAVTGGGFKQPRTGDRADVESLVGWQPTKHSIIAIGGYDGKRALGGGNLPVYNTARRWDAMAAYADKRFRLGVQYFRATDWNQVRSPKGDRASGWSAWASVQLNPQWALFARHDRADTSELLDPARRERYTNFGLEWNVNRSLQLAAVYKRERLANASRALASSNEVGVWAQIAY